MFISWRIEGITLEGCEDVRPGKRTTFLGFLGADMRGVPSRCLSSTPGLEEEIRRLGRLRDALEIL